MNRIFSKAAWFVVVIASSSACSSQPSTASATVGRVYAATSTTPSTEICNCPLETPDSAPCVCPPLDGGQCVSPPGGRCGGFTQDPCVCARGSKCVPNRIPDVPGVCAVCDPIVCPSGERWDEALCECVASTSECVAASDCHGALPDLCRVCSDGLDGCAHWMCVAGRCEIAYCP